MTFLNKVKAANAVASIVIIAATIACIFRLPDPEAWRLLSLIVTAAGAWLLADRVKDKAQ